MLDYYKWSYQDSLTRDQDQTVGWLFNACQRQYARTGLSTHQARLDTISKQAVDIAAGKTYALSSAYASLSKTGEVHRGSPFFFHTDFGKNQSITIDLGSIYQIEGISLWNRLEHLGHRARCLFCSLGVESGADLTDSFPLSISKEFLIDGGQHECLTILNDAPSARYVTIHSPEYTALHFSQIKVWAPA